MKTKKILVEVVATAMIVAPLAQPARVFNVHALDTTPVVQTTTESPVLQNATVLIPSDATVGQVTEILNKALIKNLDNEFRSYDDDLYYEQIVNQKKVN